MSVSTPFPFVSKTHVDVSIILSLSPLSPRPLRSISMVEKSVNTAILWLSDSRTSKVIEAAEYTSTHNPLLHDPMEFEPTAPVCSKELSAVNDGHRQGGLTSREIL